MYTNAITTLTLLSGLASAMPAAIIAPRQANACFVVGNEQLPDSTAAVVEEIKNSVTCSDSDTTIDNVPDVTSGGQTFSQIDFSSSGQTPLEFALGLFQTAVPLADSNLEAFTDARNVYLATEAGIRSTGGQFLPIKVPKFFIEMQMSRIQTARGDPPTDPALQVDHLRDKVTQNGAGEDQALLDQVIQLATQLQ